MGPCVGRGPSKGLKVKVKVKDSGWAQFSLPGVLYTQEIVERHLEGEDVERQWEGLPLHGQEQGLEHILPQE